MLLLPTEESAFSILHPAVLLFYLGVVIFGALLVTQPLLLVSAFLAVLVCIFAAGGGPVWAKSVKYFLVMMVLFMVINTLVNNMGNTLLWPGVTLPVLGRVRISLEVLIYSLVMSLRLFIVYSAFVLYNHALDPHRALSLFAGVFPRSTLLVALAAKAIPYLGQQVRRVAEIQQTRGIQYHSGGLYQRIKNRIPLLKVVFLSSLEDSFDTGESIQARAYGSGPRTRYTALAMKLPDYFVLTASLAAGLTLTWGYLNSIGSLQFFPVISGFLFSGRVLLVGSIISLSLLAPAAVTRGCRK